MSKVLPHLLPFIRDSSCLVNFEVNFYLKCVRNCVGSVADIKESVKETATGAKDYAKDTASSAAEKGRGKSPILLTCLVGDVGIILFRNDGIGQKRGFSRSGVSEGNRSESS